MLNGMACFASSSWLLASSFQSGSFHECSRPLINCPQRLVQRSRHACFLAPLHDRAVHEIDLGLALGEDILQHAGAVLAGSVGAFLHQRRGSPCNSIPNSFATASPSAIRSFEQLSGGREAGRRAVMQQRERADGIGGGIEDQLGPLRAASVFQGDRIHAGASDQAGKFFDLCPSECWWARTARSRCRLGCRNRCVRVRSDARRETWCRESRTSHARR